MSYGSNPKFEIDVGSGKYKGEWATNDKPFGDRSVDEIHGLVKEALKGIWAKDKTGKYFKHSNKPDQYPLLLVVPDGDGQFELLIPARGDDTKYQLTDGGDDGCIVM